jgi:hypothetical protein
MDEMKIINDDVLKNKKDYKSLLYHEFAFKETVLLDDQRAKELYLLIKGIIKFKF